MTFKHKIETETLASISQMVERFCTTVDRLTAAIKAKKISVE